MLHDFQVSSGIEPVCHLRRDVHEGEDALVVSMQGDCDHIYLTVLREQSGISLTTRILELCHTELIVSQKAFLTKMLSLQDIPPKSFLHPGLS